MIQNNKLDKSFGPIGAIAGITLFLVGIILLLFSLSGLFLILLGAFVGFTSTSTMIDMDKKRVRLSNDLFGIIKTGRWINIEPTMKIGIEQSNRTWRAYSRGSQSVDITNKDFRLILYDENNKQIVQLKKDKSFDSLKVKLELLSKHFGIRMI